MSHEVRTPLNVIVGCAGLLMERVGSGASEADRKAFTAVYQQSHVLSKVITDVLQMARADAGQITLSVSACPLAEVVRDLHTFVDCLNMNGKLEIVWEVDEELPVIRTDRSKLKQVLENLIRNAFKYTPQGRLGIAVHSSEAEDRVTFSFSDTGLGITKADLDRVFDSFYRGKSTGRDAAPGVGLGLSVAKRYIELMEGSITVESEWGVGTTFTVTLPRVMLTGGGASPAMLPS